MTRAKDNARRTAQAIGEGSAPIVDGVTLGSTRPPAETSRRASGTPQRSFTDAKKASKPRVTSATALKLGSATAVVSKKRLKKPAAPAPQQSKLSSPVPLNRARQRQAEARTKGAQIKKAGIESRLLGHVSGSVKRNQARRDSKNA